MWDVTNLTVSWISIWTRNMLATWWNTKKLVLLRQNLHYNFGMYIRDQFKEHRGHMRMSDGFKSTLVIKDQVPYDGTIRLQLLITWRRYSTTAASYLIPRWTAWKLSGEMNQLSLSQTDSVSSQPSKDVIPKQIKYYRRNETWVSRVIYRTCRKMHTLHLRNTMNLTFMNAI